MEHVNANLKMSIFAEPKCHFTPVSIRVYTAPIHNFTCQHEARQALIDQLVLGLTGETTSIIIKAVHVYPPFFDITCSAKNYKIAPALTMLLVWKELQQETCQFHGMGKIFALQQTIISEPAAAPTGNQEAGQPCCQDCPALDHTVTFSKSDAGCLHSGQMKSSGSSSPS